MALTQLDYPVTGTTGNFNNIFPSQKELNINFERKDVSISSIASGTGGVVEMTVGGTLDANLIEGDYIVWSTDSYQLQTARVTNVISTTVIEVDTIFDSTDASNGYMNYRKGWFLEARFVSSNTATDQQTGVSLVIDDFSQVPSSLDGAVSLDLSIVKDVLSPNLSISTGVNTSASKLFKVQYRESYETNRNASWISPTFAPYNDTPILLVLANSEIEFNTFTESSQSLFAESYPLMITYIYSDINDGGSSTLNFTLSQYSLNKSFISDITLGSFSDTSGVINLFVDPSTIDDDAVFLTVDVSTEVSASQYDPSDYDPVQYA